MARWTATRRASIYEARDSGCCNQRHKVTSETPAASAASFVVGSLSKAMIAFSCLLVVSEIDVSSVARLAFAFIFFHHSGIMTKLRQ